MRRIWYAVADPAVREIVLQVHPNAQAWHERSGSPEGESEVLIVGTEYLLRTGSLQNVRMYTVVYLSAVDARHIGILAEIFQRGISVVTSASELAAATATDRSLSHCTALHDSLRARRPPELVFRLIDLMVTDPDARSVGLDDLVKRLGTSRSVLYRACGQCGITPRAIAFAFCLGATLNNHPDAKLAIIAHYAGYSSERSLRRAVQASGLSINELRRSPEVLADWLDRKGIRGGRPDPSPHHRFPSP